MIPATLTPPEAGEYLGVGAHVVRRLIRDGKLATVPDLPGQRVAVAELDRFVALGVTPDPGEWASCAACIIGRIPPRPGELEEVELEA